ASDAEFVTAEASGNEVSTGSGSDWVSTLKRVWIDRTYPVATAPGTDAITKMPKTPPKKRTAQIVPKKSTKRHAAIVEKVPPTTLITGGTGFHGAHLVRQLVESGTKDIRVMATSIPEWLTGLGVDTFEGSITNEEDVARAVEGVTEIYHLAGKVSREKDDAREMYKLHVDGTRLLCDAAKKAGVKTIVLASSSGTMAVSKKGDLIHDDNY